MAKEMMKVAVDQLLEGIMGLSYHNDIQLAVDFGPFSTSSPNARIASLAPRQIHNRTR
jgi:hypothetical protein